MNVNLKYDAAGLTSQPGDGATGSALFPSMAHEWPSLSGKAVPDLC